MLSFANLHTILALSLLSVSLSLFDCARAAPVGSAFRRWGDASELPTTSSITIHSQPLSEILYPSETYSSHPHPATTHLAPLPDTHHSFWPSSSADRGTQRNRPRAVSEDPYRYDDRQHGQEMLNLNHPPPLSTEASATAPFTHYQYPVPMPGAFSHGIPPPPPSYLPPVMYWSPYSFPYYPVGQGGYLPNVMPPPPAFYFPGGTSDGGGQMGHQHMGMQVHSMPHGREEGGWPMPPLPPHLPTQTEASLSSAPASSEHDSVSSESLPEYDELDDHPPPKKDEGGSSHKARSQANYGEWGRAATIKQRSQVLKAYLTAAEDPAFADIIAKDGIPKKGKYKYRVRKHVTQDIADALLTGSLREKRAALETLSAKVKPSTAGKFGPRGKKQEFVLELASEMKVNPHTLNQQMKALDVNNPHLINAIMSRGRDLAKAEFKSLFGDMVNKRGRRS